MEFSHRPVLFRETIDALSVRPDGIYIDGTAGGGGHSAGILDRLSQDGLLLAIDQDPDAIEAVTARFQGRQNVRILRGNYSQMHELAATCGVTAVDGVLLDIGVSSHQLDTPERGFSYHTDAPLDMRMSQEGVFCRRSGQYAFCAGTDSDSRLVWRRKKCGADCARHRVSPGNRADSYNIGACGNCQGSSARKGAQGRKTSGTKNLSGVADRGERGTRCAFRRA